MKIKQLKQTVAPTDLDLLTWSSAIAQWIASAAPASLDDVYDCPAGVNVLDLVYHTGVANAVDQADANDAGKQPVIGAVVSKPTPTTCIVRHYGILGGFVGLTPGATYWLSTTPGGAMLAPPPSDPGDVQQRIGFAKNANEMFLMIDRDYKSM